MAEATALEHGHLPREILPMPDRQPPGPPAFDAREPEATYVPIEQLRPPAGAPNVVVILLDDAGFGSNSAFGGPCRTPTFERLAANGLRYTRFHTTAMCSPTRQALLTGRNHHSVGMGAVADMATAAPGYTSRRPNTAATIAETLRLNGYSTAQFGKCHEVPPWETSPMGPVNSGRSPRTGRSSSTLRRGRRMRRSTFRPTGGIATGASSTRDGTRSASRRSPGRRRWGS